MHCRWSRTSSWGGYNKHSTTVFQLRPKLLVADKDYAIFGKRASGLWPQTCGQPIKHATRPVVPGLSSVIQQEGCKGDIGLSVMIRRNPGYSMTYGMDIPILHPDFGHVPQFEQRDGAWGVLSISAGRYAAAYLDKSIFRR